MRRPTLPRPDDIREQVGERLPDTLDVPSTPTPTVPDRATFRRAATGLLTAGLSLTGLGLLLRYLLGREDRDGSEEGADALPVPESTWDYEGPRIAPLVGMGCLVVMRFVIERLRPDLPDA